MGAARRWPSLPGSLAAGGPGRGPAPGAAPGELQEALAYAVAGENLERESFLQTLLEGGYERRPVVEERGEFSVRGGIIDLFPPLYDQPVRLEFWGDEVESLRFFDPASQRSQGSLEELLVLPASEVILDAGARDHALARRKRRQDPQFWQNVQLGRHFPRIERHLEDFYEQPCTLSDLCPRTPWWWSGTP